MKKFLGAIFAAACLLSSTSASFAASGRGHPDSAGTPSHKKQATQQKQNLAKLAESFCSNWNARQHLEKVLCEPGGDMVLFSIDKSELIGYRGPESLPKAEYVRLNPLLGLLWSGAPDSLPPELKAAVKTADGYCREASKAFAENTHKTAEADWRRSGKIQSYDDYWIRQLWEDAPKTKCAQGTEPYPALPPHLRSAPSSDADLACRIFLSIAPDKGCAAAGSAHVLLWQQESDYGSRTGTDLANFEFTRLAPKMFHYWSVPDLKAMETISVRLKNGNCKTVDRATGLKHEKKWEDYTMHHTVSEHELMSLWFEDGWKTAKEQKCPDLKP